MPCWIVAQTHSRRERFAQEAIERAGLEVYLPRIRSRQNRKIRIAPLFPNYVFVRTEETWAPVMRAQGVARLLWNGERPARLDDKIVAELRSREKGGFVQLPKENSRRRGEPVRILRGAFEGRAAIWQEMSGPDRERVLLDWLGRKVTIELSRADLGPISGS